MSRLARRLLLLELARSTDRARIVQSRLVWLDDGSGVFRLRILGVINGLLPAGVQLHVMVPVGGSADRLDAA